MHVLDPLEDLLQRRAPWRSSEGLLACLAAAATAREPAREAFARALESAASVAWDDLGAWVSRWPKAPAAVAEYAAWLVDLEALGLARFGLAAMARHGVEEAALLERIDAALAAAKEQVDRRTDQVLVAGKAASRLDALQLDAVQFDKLQLDKLQLDKLQLDVAPWRWFSVGNTGNTGNTGVDTAESAARRIDAFLASSDDALHVVCEHWLDGKLHVVDCDVLLKRVQVEGVVRDAYRAAVQARVKTLWVTRWNAAWSLDVLRDAQAEEDLATATPVLEVWLPHVDETLEVYLHEGGLHWTYGPDTLVPLVDDIDVSWGDATLGMMTTRLRVVSPSAPEDIWHGLGSLRRVARGEGLARGASIVRSLTQDLTDGAMAECLASAHRSFEDGSDVDEADERLLNHALAVRLVMSDALSALSALSDVGEDVFELARAIEEMDKTHAAHTSATLLVEETLYDELTRGIPMDTALWWGRRALLDREVPRSVVDRALEELSEERAELADERADERVDERADASAGEGVKGNKVIPLLRETAPKQEYTRVAAADRSRDGASSLTWCGEDGPAIGCAPVMLVSEDKQGVRAELRVRVDKRASAADLWRDASLLQAVAKETIRDAWLAAGRMSTSTVPPFAFEQHRLEFVVEGMSLGEVDGRSLGLSAALAFASAWSNTPVARGLMM